jgi:hypothetical protein
MSRIRMILTFAAEIQHLQEKVGTYAAPAKGTVRSGKQSIGIIISVQAGSLKGVVPFAVQNDVSELLAGGILYVTKLG